MPFPDSENKLRRLQESEARGTPAAAAAKSLQSCLTLCDPIDGSPPGSPVPGILQARTGVGCHFLLQCVKVKLLSRVWLLVTSWTAAHQAPPSMRFFQARVLEWGAIAFSSTPASKQLNLPTKGNHQYVFNRNMTIYIYLFFFWLDTQGSMEMRLESWDVGGYVWKLSSVQVKDNEGWK